MKVSKKDQRLKDQVADKNLKIDNEVNATPKVETGRSAVMAGLRDMFSGFKEFVAVGGDFV